MVQEGKQRLSTAKTIDKDPIAMNHRCIAVIAVFATFFCVTALHAQSGCTDSPENPTAVLAVVGGAGALFSTVRARMRARRK
jgi:XrtJ-associated TM-motif-TM protein